MREPMVGDRVTFRDGEGLREAVVQARFLAGRPGARGIYRQRERVWVVWDEHGVPWGQNRDLDAVTVIESTQLSLF